MGPSVPVGLTRTRCCYLVFQQCLEDWGKRGRGGGGEDEEFERKLNVHSTEDQYARADQHCTGYKHVLQFIHSRLVSATSVHAKTVTTVGPLK